MTYDPSTMKMKMTNKPWHPTGNRFLVPLQPLSQPRPRMH
jgi:hypothetical protein